MEIRWDQILFQVINFGIILFVLRRFVYGPVLKMLDDRASKIKDGLQAAEKNLKIQADMEEKQRQVISESRNEAKKLVEDAKIEAQEILKKAKEQAKADAKKSLVKEKEAFEANMAKQVADFKKQASSLVAQATEAVLKDSLSVKVQQDLIDKQINELTPQYLD